MSNGAHSSHGVCGRVRHDSHSVLPPNDKSEPKPAHGIGLTRHARPPVVVVNSRRCPCRSATSSAPVEPIQTEQRYRISGGRRLPVQGNERSARSRAPVDRARAVGLRAGLPGYPGRRPRERDRVDERRSVWLRSPLPPTVGRVEEPVRKREAVLRRGEREVELASCGCRLAGGAGRGPGAAAVGGAFEPRLLPLAVAGEPADADQPTRATDEGDPAGRVLAVQDVRVMPHRDQRGARRRGERPQVSGAPRRERTHHNSNQETLPRVRTPAREIHMPIRGKADRRHPHTCLTSHGPSPLQLQRN